MSEDVKWNRTISDVNDGILANLGKPHPTYYAAWGMAIVFLLIGAITWGLEITYGMGITGKTSPVYWGVLITDFVFWVGIGHAGTLISAILFLFRAKWRNTVNRSAEAMTVFAVITVLDSTPAEHQQPLVEPAFTPGLGLVRDLDLSDHLAPFLVHGSGA
jgi:hypothetical protein